MCVNGSGISEIIIIPNRIKDFFPGKSNSLIFQKVSKKLKFLKAKIHRLVIDCCKMGSLIDHNSPCAEHIFRSGLSGTAKDSFYSGYQDLRAEWLGNILIHTQVKTKKLITLISSCCQHNDRHFGILAHLTAYFPAVHLWHHYIQDDQGNIFFFIKDIHGFLAISCFQHLKILLC